MVIKTSAGNTASYHQGVDYGTNGKNIPQYAIESGYVFSASTASDGAKYVWVIYPRIKVAMLHYHLATIAVKSGQKVAKGTKLGTTGATGKATGIHLHLGHKDLSSLSDSRIRNMTYAALRGISYSDPEIFASVYLAEGEKTKTGNPYMRPTYVLSRSKYEYGKIKTGNAGVKWLQWELQRVGSLIGKIDGFFGPVTEQAVKNFQKSHGLEADGKAYDLTFDALEGTEK